jgi:hypothetical protein
MDKKQRATVPKVPTSKPIPRKEDWCDRENIAERKKAKTITRPAKRIQLFGRIKRPFASLPIIHRIKEVMMPIANIIPFATGIENCIKGRKKNGNKRIVAAKV